MLLISSVMSCLMTSLSVQLILSKVFGQLFLSVMTTSSLSKVSLLPTRLFTSTVVSFKVVSFKVVGMVKVAITDPLSSTNSTLLLKLTWFKLFRHSILRLYVLLILGVAIIDLRNLTLLFSITSPNLMGKPILSLFTVICQ